MNKLFATLVIYTLFIGCGVQKKTQSVNCNGNVVQVGLLIKGQAPCFHCVVDKKFLKNGFSLHLQDSTYKIVKFTVSYFNFNTLLFQREVRGNRFRSREIDSLYNLSDGDMISIDCIYLVKNKEPFLSTTMLILVE